MVYYITTPRVKAPDPIVRHHRTTSTRPLDERDHMVVPNGTDMFDTTLTSPGRDRFDDVFARHPSPDDIGDTRHE